MNEDDILAMVKLHYIMVYCHPSHAMDILLKVKVTLWLFNIAMENGPFIDGLPIKNGGFFHGYLK